MGGQFDMQGRAAAALGDGGIHHRLQPVPRDDEIGPEGDHPVGQ